MPEQTRDRSQRPISDQPGLANISDGSDIGALEQDDTLFRDGFGG